MHIEFPEISVPVQGIDAVEIPPMVRIRQVYDASYIEDVAGHLHAELDKLPDHGSYAGKRIAITAGSRGIPHIVDMLQVICDTLKVWGASPFIVPAMGSHGGATAEGQLQMLEGYGITEQALGVPIVSSMEAVAFSRLGEQELYCGKAAFESDGIVVFNKVKPHTDFRGPHESGLAKMMAIGIAKHKGAAALHSFGFDRFRDMVPAAAREFIAHCPVAFGVGVVQNAYDDICCIEACTPEDLMATDARLLKIAKERIAKFKFTGCDVLVIDEVGKNFSGNGHDPNVTGRSLTGSCSDEFKPKKMVILGVTEQSHGNGAGLAACDCTTRRVLDGIDWSLTWTNVLTTGVTKGACIPLYANTDEQAIKVCLATSYRLDCAQARIAHIANTMELDEIEVSQALYEDIKDRSDVELIRGPEPFAFDAQGFVAK